MVERKRKNFRGTQGHSRIPGGGLAVQVWRSDCGRSFHGCARPIGFRDEVRPGIRLLVHQDRPISCRLDREVRFREVCGRFRGYRFGSPLWTFRVNEVQARVRVLGWFLMRWLNTFKLYFESKLPSSPKNQSKQISMLRWIQTRTSIIRIN